jgi:hypothetical protein
MIRNTTKVADSIRTEIERTGKKKKPIADKKRSKSSWRLTNQMKIFMEFLVVFADVKAPR